MTANGNGPRTNGEALAVGAAQSFRNQTTNPSPDCHGQRHAHQAAETIEGEAYAAAYLERLRIGTASPGELAVILTFLQGEMLHGACRLIEKTLEGRRDV